MSQIQSFPDYSATERVSQRVNHLLYINDMTQRELAMQMGTKHTTIGNKMSRGNRWNIDEILLLADIFEVSTDYMLGREPLEAVKPVNAKVPASEETGTSGLVAGTGFEPATSGL